MAKPPFSLEQVRSFIAVAEAESVSGAADALYLSQGAVTQQVRHFERALGLQLLERTGGRVRLTAAGQDVARACRSTYRSVESLIDTARMLRSLEVGSLHLGASPTAAAHYLPRLLAEFCDRFPGVDVSVVTAVTPAVLEKVLGGELDCGLVEGHVETEALERQTVAFDEVLAVVAAGHPLAGAEGVTPAELGRERYLGREQAAALELTAAQLLGDAYRSVRRIELGTLDAIRGAALAGLGFAIMPRVAVAAELESGALVALPLPAVRRPILAIRRRSPGAPAAEEFWEQLARAAA